MKITKELIDRFELEQKEYGTKVAIHNLLWLNASEQMKDLGIKSVHTSDEPQVSFCDVLGMRS